MQLHIGTKQVTTQPMTRQAYNDYRGWTLPADEDGTDEGYLVEYLDGGKPNHPAHAGYISWSPKAQFDAAYRPTTGMTFGLAIEALKVGKRVERAGWNGRGMWLILVAYSRSASPEDHPHYHHHGVADVEGLPWLGIKTSDNKFVPWLASQTDMLADDWQIVE